MSHNLNDETKAALKAKYPGVKLRAVTIGDDTFVLRTPKREDWQFFEQDYADPDKRQIAKSNLLTQCVVYPADPSAVFARKPGFPSLLIDHVAELAGLNEKVFTTEL